MAQVDLYTFRVSVEHEHPDLKTYYCAFCPKTFDVWKPFYDHARRSHHVKLSRSNAAEFKFRKSIDQIAQKNQLALAVRRKEVNEAFQINTETIQEQELILPDLPVYSEAETRQTVNFQSLNRLKQSGSHSQRRFNKNSNNQEKAEQSDDSSDPDFIPDPDESSSDSDQDEVFEEEEEDFAEAPKKSKPDRAYQKLIDSTYKYKFKCGHCNSGNVRFLTQAQLDTHKRKRHLKDPAPYRCEDEEYSKKFRTRFALRRHNTANHGDAGLFVCPICEKEYPINLRRKLIAHHMKFKHPGTEKYSGRICHYKLFFEQDYKDHERRHKEGSYVCVSGKCFHNTSFKTRTDYGSPDALRRHVIKDHEEALKCKICQKLCQDEYRLNIHQLTHTEENPVQCKLCTQRFMRSYDLRNHERKVHSKSGYIRIQYRGPKKYVYKCHLCPRTFNFKPFRTSHIKIAH